MKEEVSSAVGFLTEQLSSNSPLPIAQIELFRATMEQLVMDRFQDHWHPEKPLKGNAFRCINVDTTAIDPLLVKACNATGFSPIRLQEVFPDGLALWIDPEDVCCRVGRTPIRTIYGHNRSSPYASPVPMRKQPLAPINYNTSPYYCSTTSRNRIPKYFQNKENFNRFHWVNRDLTYMTAQVY